MQDTAAITATQHWSLAELLQMAYALQTVLQAQMQTAVQTAAIAGIQE
jgi:hypothetical protein